MRLYPKAFFRHRYYTEKCIGKQIKSFPTYFKVYNIIVWLAMYNQSTLQITKSP